MGTPYTIMVKGQPVFLCCKGCAKKALANPDKTLATVAELTEIGAALAKLNAEDRHAAEAQEFCPIMTTKRLGAMGAPIKVVIKGRPVFVCCKGCAKKALANPDKALARVAELAKAKAGARNL